MHLIARKYGITVHSLDDPSTIVITVKASKTPYRPGVVIYPGATSKLCLVKVLLVFIMVRGDASGPLFKFANEQVPTGETFLTHTRSMLSKVGLNPDMYAGHSFRIAVASPGKGIHY